MASHVSMIRHSDHLGTQEMAQFELNSQPKAGKETRPKTDTGKGNS
jgi:hypothetical protein